jgi:hypothetical protein
LTFSLPIFFTEYRKTVAGSEESSVFNGIKGENAVNETVTGAAGSRYSTVASGYSPRKEISEKPVWSSGRNVVFPAWETRIPKPCASGEVGIGGCA